MPATSYVVTGMTCAHCVHAVTDEVSALAGVTDVSVDLASGRMTMVSADAVPFATVAAAVDEAGYVLLPPEAGHALLPMA